MFSFQKKGSIKPIAEVKGGKENTKILYLFRKPTDGKIPAGYFDNIELPRGSKFIYYPDVRQNFSDCVTLSGKKGVGKSTLASEMAMKIKDELDLTDDDVIVCKKSGIEDKAYEKLNPQYLYIDHEFEENPPTIDEICGDSRPKVVLLDDMDNIIQNSLKKKYQEFQDSLLREGRKYRCYVIICTHRLAQGKDTKAMLTESDLIGFFPAGITSDLKYALQRYCDFSLDFIRSLKKCNSRWVLISNQNPVYILTENRCFIFDDDRERDILDSEKEVKKEVRILKRINKDSGISEDEEED